MRCPHLKYLPYNSIKNRYQRLLPELTEKTRRIWAAAEALELGYGGISAVSKATHLTHRTIRRGIAEIRTRENLIRW
jgi:hypothetical protein